MLLQGLYDEVVCYAILLFNMGIYRKSNILHISGRRKVDDNQVAYVASNRGTAPNLTILSRLDDVFKKSLSSHQRCAPRSCCSPNRGDMNARLYSHRRVPYSTSTINTWEAMRIFWILDMGYRIWDTGYGLWIRSKEPKFN